MKTKLVLAMLVALVGWGGTAEACSPLFAKAFQLAKADKTQVAVLEADLRAAGPDGMKVMALVRSTLVRQLETLQQQPPDDGGAAQAAAQAALKRFDESMDRVGRARYCSQSQLYWYTDFDAAKKAAQQTGKPILSLRLLGNLTDEYSCANSRFFRTTLYANAEISQLLRDNFVLHWKSVRPVPVVTIDFGDGRKLQRTLTGNSIHYILAPTGEVVDALPGLYGPKAFQEQLGEALAAIRELGDTASPDWNQRLSEYHRDRLRKLDAAWEQDLAAARMSGVAVDLRGQPAGPGQQLPNAAQAANIAVPKRRIEVNLIRAATPLAVEPNELKDEQMWGAIAALHAEDARLDDASLALIRSQNPTAAQAGRIAVTKAIVEDPLVRMVRTFQGAIALDTVKNEYQLHRQIHRWFVAVEYRPDVDRLNERVYAQLFLTPSNDPWIGLAPADAYTALENGGVSGQRIIGLHAQ